MPQRYVSERDAEKHFRALAKALIRKEAIEQWEVDKIARESPGRSYQTALEELVRHGNTWLGDRGGRARRDYQVLTPQRRSPKRGRG